MHAQMNYKDCCPVTYTLVATRKHFKGIYCLYQQGDGGSRSSDMLVYN